ncbi:MAG TPA: quinone-dependent dihydroorotate dehydrogenase [Anaerolineaceae bacterium]|jgi:dihydroorotate dehydrogenase
MMGEPHSRLYRLLQPWIFRLDPEQAHKATVFLLRLAGETLPGRLVMRTLFPPPPAGPRVRAFGLDFINPVGLAAGYDKDGLAWRGLAQLGMGHLEIGTVTPRPQTGNPSPRIFRLVEDRAVINRMGFPNQGAQAIARRLRGRRPKDLVLGVNIGKNKTTPLERSTEDYLDLLSTFAPLADYLAVNVSSPNTPNLRALQAYPALASLLSSLVAERDRLRGRLAKPLPLLVKLAPDLTSPELDDALRAITDSGIDGVILSNTTLRREGVISPRMGETGGLSGAPLQQQTACLVQEVYRRSAGRLPIVASGGIMSPGAAQQMLDAGAALVQLYTGLIYEGPGLVSHILGQIR